jgi:hypothetical protein
VSRRPRDEFGVVQVVEKILGPVGEFVRVGIGPVERPVEGGGGGEPSPTRTRMCPLS